MRVLRSLSMLVMFAAPGSRAASAQPIRDYYGHLPNAPRIVGHAPASARLGLYGDPARPGFVDHEPADGIDDRRAARLLDIAARFAPILRRNAILVPRLVWDVLGDSAVLEVDTFVGARRVQRDAIGIDARPTQDSSGRSAADAKLAALVEELDPCRLVSATQPPAGSPDKVLYFDLPGDDEESWRAFHEARGRSGSRIYAHFLIDEDTLATDGRRYMLAVQFIFLYPFNDGGNNHEGDWEHINVLIATRGSVADTTRGSSTTYVDSLSIDAILDGTTPLDSLVIASVDYFFHKKVLRLDYLGRGTPPIDSASPMWEDHRYARMVVEARLAAHGGAFATHPIGYIGGNNTGPDELLHPMPRFGRSYNRNTGATYPFPGTWQTVAPLGATERVWGTVVPDILRETIANGDAGATTRTAPDGDQWLSYGRADIELLPDWELMLPLIRRDPEFRRRWAWFVLPVRWGYPATQSPGAGAVGRTDLGNLAPFGPAFKPWWNRIGEDDDHATFHVRTLRTPMSPRVFWSIIQSGWGFLNFPLVVSQVVPFYNMAGAHLSPWTVPIADRIGIGLPRTFVASGYERIATIGVGAVRPLGGDDFARRLRLADHPRVDAIRDDGARLGTERVEMTTGTWPRFSLDLHIGRSYFIENSFTMGEGTVSYAVPDLSTGSDVSLTGKVEIRQFTGGFRSALPWIARTDHQAFARLGYGWSWYRVRDVTLDGAEIAGPLKGGYAPPIFPGRRSWPNFGYAGLTYEFFPGRGAWLFDRLGTGFRIDGTFVLQRFPSHEFGAAKDLWRGQGQISAAATIGW